MKVFINRLQRLCLLITIGIFSTSALASTFVGELQEIDVAKRTMLVSDSPYRFNGFTIVRRVSDSEDTRLPLTTLRKGMWLAISSEYRENINGFSATLVVILPNESAANSLQQALEDD